MLKKFLSDGPIEKGQKYVKREGRNQVDNKGSLSKNKGSEENRFRKDSKVLKKHEERGT